MRGNGVLFLCLVLLLECFGRAICIWDFFWFEFVVGVWFSQESQRLSLLALCMYCSAIIGCAVVQVHLSHLSLVPGLARVHVVPFMKIDFSGVAVVGCCIVFLYLVIVVLSFSKA